MAVTNKGKLARRSAHGLVSTGHRTHFLEPTVGFGVCKMLSYLPQRYPKRATYGRTFTVSARFGLESPNCLQLKLGLVLTKRSATSANRALSPTKHDKLRVYLLYKQENSAFLYLW